MLRLRSELLYAANNLRVPVQLEMEAEDVAEERRRAEDPDPLDEDACIILQGLSKRFPAEVRADTAAAFISQRVLPQSRPC